MSWIEILAGVISGGTLQYVVSTKVMPKKEKKDADAYFIDTLIKRIDVLETRVDNQTAIIKDLIKENESLKSEIRYLQSK